MNPTEFHNTDEIARLKGEAASLLASRSPKCLEVYGRLQKLAPSLDIEEAIAFAYTFLDDYSRAADAFANLLFKKRSPPSDHYERSSSLRQRNISGTTFKFQDWRDQLELLVRERYIHSSFAALIKDAGILVRALQERSRTHIYAPLEHDLAQRLHGFGDTLIYWDECQEVGRALNADIPWRAVASEFAKNGCVYIDSFLTNEMLATLRRFTTLSTIFYRFGEAGYVGAYINDGFCGRALFQLVSEIKERLGPIAGGLPLTNMWAYRYSPIGPGVRAHSDTGRVTVNFWLTPDAANRNPEEGGLIVYDAKFPHDRDWMASNWSKDSTAERAFFDAYLRGVTEYRIPYRENRCVIFKSSFMHRSMPYHFSPTLDGRRVNVTIIFGGLASEQLDVL